MLKANAWPFPVFEDVALEVQSATFQGRPLEKKITSRGVVIEGQHLRELSAGDVILSASIPTTLREISEAVFGNKSADGIVAGFRVLCETTKYRDFIPVSENQTIQISIPLGKTRGVVSVAPIFRTTRSREANGWNIPAGATIGLSRDSIFLTIDEDWTGQQIPIDWLDFGSQNPPLPNESFVHVELSGSGQVIPKAWLNKKFEPEIGRIINHAGLNSPPGVARHIFRQFILLQIWQNVLIWAIKHENEESVDWPSTRITGMWRDRFQEFEWELPRKDELTMEILDDLSLKIQHCLKTGQELAYAKNLWSF
jgi:hypothetical protein